MPAPTALRIGSQRAALACACAVGFAFSANYTNHAPVIGVLARQFGFSQVLGGLLTTGIFITHAAMQVPGGYLVDRLGSRRVLIFALAWVALGNVAIAFSGAYWQLLAWKIFTGIGTGTCFVAGARYIHEALGGPRLPVAQGMYGGSILLGSGFVILAVPRISLWTSWRVAFLVSATVAVCVWIIWIAASPQAPSVARAREQLRGMLLSPQLWLLGLMQMASFGLTIVVGTWIITLLVGTLQVPAPKAGVIGSLVLLLGIVMRPLGGILRRHMGMRALLALSFLSNAAGCFMLAAGWNSFPHAMAAVLLIGAGCGLPYAALFTRAASLFPGRAAAAMGLVNMLGILMILVGAPLVGRLTDWSGSFRSSFVALGGFSLAAGAAVSLVSRDEPATTI
ncbi:MAG TPA: MFS transporter [Bryobacteraceae bacterium]|nr:MFS transporter [Bryobacteraceae bacterium]